jgi:hypothetical protein
MVHWIWPPNYQNYILEKHYTSHMPPQRIVQNYINSKGRIMSALKYMGKEGVNFLGGRTICIDLFLVTKIEFIHFQTLKFVINPNLVLLRFMLK